jgi:hypothetical protein
MQSLLQKIPLVNSIFTNKPKPVSKLEVLAPQPTTKPKFIVVVPKGEDQSSLESALSSKLNKEDYLIQSDPSLPSGKVRLCIIKDLNLINSTGSLDENFRKDNYQTFQFDKSSKLIEILVKKIFEAQSQFEQTSNDHKRDQINLISAAPTTVSDKEIAALINDHGPNCGCPIHGGGGSIKLDQSEREDLIDGLINSTSYNAENKSIDNRLTEALDYYSSVKNLPEECSTHDKILKDHKNIFIILQNQDSKIKSDYLILVARKESNNDFKVQYYTLEDYSNGIKDRTLKNETLRADEMHSKFHNEVSREDAFKILSIIDKQLKAGTGVEIKFNFESFFDEKLKKFNDIADDQDFKTSFVGMLQTLENKEQKERGNAKLQGKEYVETELSQKPQAKLIRKLSTKSTNFKNQAKQYILNSVDDCYQYTTQQFRRGKYKDVSHNLLEAYQNEKVTLSLNSSTLLNNTDIQLDDETAGKLAQSDSKSQKFIRDLGQLPAAQNKYVKHPEKLQRELGEEYKKYKESDASGRRRQAIAINNVGGFALTGAYSNLDKKDELIQSGVYKEINEKIPVELTKAATAQLIAENASEDVKEELKLRGELVEEADDKNTKEDNPADSKKTVTTTPAISSTESTVTLKTSIETDATDNTSSSSESIGSSEPDTTDAPEIDRDEEKPADTIS